MHVVQMGDVATISQTVFHRHFEFFRASLPGLDFCSDSHSQRILSVILTVRVAVEHLVMTQIFEDLDAAGDLKIRHLRFLLLGPSGL